MGGWGEDLAEAMRKGSGGFGGAEHPKMRKQGPIEPITQRQRLSVIWMKDGGKDREGDRGGGVRDDAGLGSLLPGCPGVQKVGVPPFSPVHRGGFYPGSGQLALPPPCTPPF